MEIVKRDGKNCWTIRLEGIAWTAVTGKSRLTACKAVRDWCRLNCKSHYFFKPLPAAHRSAFPPTILVNFTSERDVVLFKLFFA